MMPELSYVLVTLLIGWVGLWPARGTLGRTGYHIAAYPTGMLGWGFVATVAFAFKTPYTPQLVVWSLAVFCAGLAALATLAARADHSKRTRLPWWSFLVAVGLFGAVTAILATWGISIYSHDGWGQYEIYSWLLFDSGKASIVTIGQRMLIPTAYHAAFHLFGGEFSGFMYPLMSVQIATLVGISTYRAARPAHRAAAIALAAGVVTVMVSHVMYLFMSLYVHSHMSTALYLLLTVYALWRAEEPLQAEDTRAEPGARLSAPWLLIAGLGLAGIWLSRPDGPAYAMAAVLLLAAIMITMRTRRRDIYLFFVPLLVLASSYVGATVVNRDAWWTTPKLSAQQLVYFIALYAIVWAVLGLVPFSRIGWLTKKYSFTAIVLACEALLLVWSFRYLGDQAVLTLGNLKVNLLEQQGGWRNFWPMMTAAVAVSLVFYVRTERSPFTGKALFYAFQFAVIALVVHGFTHPGRIGWGDSLNRVAFHVVPLLYLYLGLYAGGLVRALASKPVTRSDT